MNAGGRERDVSENEWTIEDFFRMSADVGPTAITIRLRSMRLPTIASIITAWFENLPQTSGSAGATVIESFNVTAFNGLSATADAIVRNMSGDLYVLEVKTGEDPTFTFKQSYVYPYLCFGNHAISNQSNIGIVGLKPGQILPKMQVIIYYSPREGVEELKGDICNFYN